MKRKNGKRHGCGFANRVKNCFGKRNCSRLELPLSENGHCRKIRVCKIQGDRKICARMASLGLYPGVEADVICPHNGNQCVLKVSGSTISLDANITENIYVTSI
jgi:ferrous iron transport protein A